ncbi:Uncharacterised protein [Orientia tsutsugamushi]|uniref:Uncharacterized protein n=1 Tax=Orientia tsutsugamushi TaxID=784 RepID=A0A2R8F350_ORITS|nr:hypothetical protein [Orientia tsutsugamushi]SPM45860.1 Uncharacterised protein [Orientia tsutsugamushi]
MVRDLSNFASNNCKITNNNSSNNDTIFYRFIGNFIPAEWKDLSYNNCLLFYSSNFQNDFCDIDLVIY